MGLEVFHEEVAKNPDSTRRIREGTQIFPVETLLLSKPDFKGH